MENNQNNQNNQINFKSEGKLLDGEDFNYNSSKEKFRIRVERQPNGYTNVYISNHILEADDVVSEGKIIWKKRESDLSREAEMLVRMMEYFGTNRVVAMESLNESKKYDKKVSIDLIDFYDDIKKRITITNNIKKAINEHKEWLKSVSHSNNDVDKEDFENHLKELQAVCDPIISKIYKKTASGDSNDDNNEEPDL